MKPPANHSQSSCETRKAEADRSVIPIDQIEYRTAAYRQDYSGAFQILQRRYREAGLARQDDGALRVLPYHLWDETQIFVAVHRRNVIGSIGLIRDSQRHGIPMQSAFPNKVSELRKAGHHIGEVCSLTADSPKTLSNGDLFGQLTRMMIFQARYVGLDYILAVVHPRHARFYQLAMGFEVIGEAVAYNEVGGQPGIPILGSVNDRLRYRSRWQKYYFEDTYTEEALRPTSMSAADKNYFGQFLLETRVAKRRKAA